MSIVAEYDVETNTLAHHGARQTFRALVAEVATRAKEKLPEAVNGRIESAVKLVLAHDITVLDDGSIEVGSSRDPMKVYHLVGTTCTCTDFTQGRAPEAWCKHRIAAGIAKRVRELLPLAPPVEPWPDNDPEADAPAPAPAPLPQVPPVEAEPLALPPGVVPTDTATPAPPPERAGMRLEAQVMIDSRQVKLALWGPDDAAVLARLQAVLAQYPVQAQPAAPADAAPLCPQHGAMQRSTKGKGWYCPHKLDDETWCPSKAK